MLNHILKLFKKSSTKVRFRAQALRGKKQKRLELLDKIDRHFDRKQEKHFPALKKSNPSKK